MYALHNKLRNVLHNGKVDENKPFKMGRDQLLEKNADETSNVQEECHATFPGA